MSTVSVAIPAALLALAVAAGAVPARWRRWPSIAAMALLAGLLAALALGGWHPQDSLAAWFFLTVSVLGGFGIWYSGPYIAHEASLHEWTPIRRRLYEGLFLAFIASLAALALWTNLFALWLAMEGATLSSVVLVALPDSSASLEAALKYLLVTETGGLIALVGTVLAREASGAPLLGAHIALAPLPWALVGAYLGLVGYAAKAGLAPLHTWLPDAHSEAPAPVSALLSGLKLAGAVVVIFRLFETVEPLVGAAWLKDPLIILGLASLLVAAAFLVFQRDLKRLWAYSSIEHIGLISLGVGFGGIALVGAVLHIWTHAVTKTLLFHNAGTVRLVYGSSHSGNGARAVLTRTPWTGALLALGAAAIVGLPPFAPFWSEWLILAGGLRQPGDRAFAVTAAGLVFAIFVAIARRVPEWLFTPGPIGAPPRDRLSEPATLIAPTVVLAILVIAGGIGLPMAVHPLWRHLVAELAAARI